MTFIIQDVPALAQQELDKYISIQAQAVAAEVEIDGVWDAHFGRMYCMWFGINLLALWENGAIRSHSHNSG